MFLARKKTVPRFTHAGLRAYFLPSQNHLTMHLSQVKHLFINACLNLLHPVNMMLKRGVSAC
jgi:hypothetical protein